MAITRFHAAAILASLAASAPLPAAALLEDRVEVFAAENVTYDSNVFRLSKDVDPQQVIGSDQKSDFISTTSAGVNLDLPYSLQRFQANFTWFANRYDRFDQLNFNGHAARAAWLWAVTPKLTGDLGYTDTQSIANFATKPGPTSREKDVLRTKQAFANGVWFPVASWRIHAGAAAIDQAHSDPGQQFNDIETATGVAGVSYVTAADSRLGVEGRFERGRTPHDELRGTPLDLAYHQDSAGVVGHWVATGHSTLDGRIDWVRRDYDQRSSRDWSGPTFRVAHTWTPTGKITVASSIYRDIGPVADVQSGSFVLVKGAAVKPSWALSDKVTIAGDAEYNIWEYRGDVLLGDYTHRVRTFGVNAAYRATRKILLTAGYVYEYRTSTAALADYKDNVVTVSARVGF